MSIVELPQLKCQGQTKCQVDQLWYVVILFQSFLVFPKTMIKMNGNKNKGKKRLFVYVYY